jgi:hypothetical protein
VDSTSGGCAFKPGVGYLGNWGPAAGMARPLPGVGAQWRGCGPPPGAGVIPEVALRPGEGVFAELAGCLKLTQCHKGGGEFVRGINGVVTLVTEHSPGSGKRVRSELSRCLVVTEWVQVASEVVGLLAVSSGFGDQVGVVSAWRVDEGVMVSLAV